MKKKKKEPNEIKVKAGGLANQDEQKNRRTGRPGRETGERPGRETGKASQAKRQERETTTYYIIGAQILVLILGRKRWREEERKKERKKEREIEKKDGQMQRRGRGRGGAQRQTVRTQDGEAQPAEEFFASSVQSYI